MKPFKFFVASILFAVFLAGCAQYENKRGVLDHWQERDAEAFVRGETSRQEVLKALGPPSQVVDLGDETILYYLYEHSAGDGLILVVYNRFKIDTRYDRAIFFFDSDDKLTDFATKFSTTSTL
jgi:outer membrane protein assembly factor BamE (lipoprotein component of BamABCDE complex)